jgi:hypothetical protein
MGRNDIRENEECNKGKRSRDDRRRTMKAREVPYWVEHHPS